MNIEMRRNILRNLLEEENIKIGIWNRELQRFELTKDLLLKELRKLELEENLKPKKLET